MTCMASSLGRKAAPVNRLIFLDERPDQPQQLIGLLHLDAMPAGAHDLEASLRQHGRIAFACALWHDFVVVSPDNERRGAYATQQMRQTLIIHVGLPRDPEAHFSTDVPFDQL